MKKEIFFKILAILCVISMVGIFDYWLFFPKKIYENGEIRNENKEIINEEIKIKENFEEDFKSEVKFDVPFTSQAPFKIWDDLHNEACEEAGLIMAKHWLEGTEITPEIAEKEILDSVDWQMKNFKDHYDLPVEKIIELGREFFKIKKIYPLYDVTINDIKRELSKGNLILAPAAGRLLKNPYYRQPGPVYHLLVVVGYNKEAVITNDPGTKRGKDFKYSWENFFEAIHDWPFDASKDYGKNLKKEEKAKEILKGKKNVIVVEK
jgi:hypothetical protein